MQLKSGEIDAITFVLFNQMEVLNKKAGITAIGIPSTKTRYIGFNNNVVPLD